MLGIRGGWIVLVIFLGARGAWDGLSVRVIRERPNDFSVGLRVHLLVRRRRRMLLASGRGLEVIGEMVDIDLGVLVDENTDEQGARGSIPRFKRTRHEQEHTD